MAPLWNTIWIPADRIIHWLKYLFFKAPNLVTYVTLSALAPQSFCLFLSLWHFLPQTANIAEPCTDGRAIVCIAARVIFVMLDACC